MQDNEGQHSTRRNYSFGRRQLIRSMGILPVLPMMSTSASATSGEDWRISDWGITLWNEDELGPFERRSFHLGFDMHFRFGRLVLRGLRAQVALSTARDERFDWYPDGRVVKPYTRIEESRSFTATVDIFLEDITIRCEQIVTFPESDRLIDVTFELTNRTDDVFSPLFASLNGEFYTGGDVDATVDPETGTIMVTRDVGTLYTTYADDWVFGLKQSPDADATNLRGTALRPADFKNDSDAKYSGYDWERVQSLIEIPPLEPGKSASFSLTLASSDTEDKVKDLLQAETSPENPDELVQRIEDYLALANEVDRLAVTPFQRPRAELTAGELLTGTENDELGVTEATEAIDSLSLILSASEPFLAGIGKEIASSPENSQTLIGVEEGTPGADSEIYLIQEIVEPVVAAAVIFDALELALKLLLAKVSFGKASLSLLLDGIKMIRETNRTLFGNFSPFPEHRQNLAANTDVVSDNIEQRLQGEELTDIDGLAQEIEDGIDTITDRTAVPIQLAFENGPNVGPIFDEEIELATERLLDSINDIDPSDPDVLASYDTGVSNINSTILETQQRIASIQFTEQLTEPLEEILGWHFDIASYEAMSLWNLDDFRKSISKAIGRVLQLLEVVSAGCSLLGVYTALEEFSEATQAITDETIGGDL